MRWEDFRRSDNVEDRTGDGPAGGGFPIGGGGIKLGGGALIVIVIVSLLFGVNPLTADRRPRVRADDRRAASAGLRAAAPTRRPTPSADPAKEFAARVLGDTEDVWSAVFQTMGARYEPPTARAVPRASRARLAASRARRRARSTARPTRRLYLDTDVLRRARAALRRARRFRAGLRDRARGRPPRAEPDRHDATRSTRSGSGSDDRGNNALSVRLELQADCYAGVWGFFAQRRGKLETGDLEEGLARPRPSATTGSRSRRRVTSCPIRSRTAPPPSVSTGSRPASRAATCASATRSPSASPERVRRPTC